MTSVEITLLEGLLLEAGLSDTKAVDTANKFDTMTAATTAQAAQHKHIYALSRQVKEAKTDDDWRLANNEAVNCAAYLIGDAQLVAEAIATLTIIVRRFQHGIAELNRS